MVTGAGRGIGRAIALGLSQAGADVVLLGRPGAQDATRDAVREIGGTVDVVDLDVGDLDAVERVGAELNGSRQVDILVNNAGIIDREDSVDVGRDAWQRVLDVNLNGMFFLCQQLGRPMVDRGHGKIVSIASLLSFQGGLRVASYAASKHGVAGVTKALANEWGPHGVQVNAIAPGYISTDNTDRPPRGPRPVPLDPRADPGRPLGHRPTTSPEPPSSSARPQPTTSTATSWSSTAAGWPAEPVGTRHTRSTHRTAHTAPPTAPPTPRGTT